MLGLMPALCITDLKQFAGADPPPTLWATEWMVSGYSP
jgi:hypothetical protein